MSIKQSDRGLSLLLILPVLLLAGGAAASGLAGTNLRGNAGNQPQSPGAGKNMSQIQLAAASRVEKPPIDAAAPAKIETATFALG
jgi:hypothetical protein